MAYREHGMWEVLEVLRRLHRGESQVVIQAATGRDRKTIRSYRAIATDLGWHPGESEPDEALAARVLERLRPGPQLDGESGEWTRKLLTHREQIQAWLSDSGGGRGLRLTKVHALLRRQGIEVPYSSLHRFAVEQCQFGKKQMTVRCAPCRPGEVSEIDFGRLGLLRDPQTGQMRLLWALVIVLVHSRHMYVHITRRQKLEDVIDGLEAAWEFFGGVTARVILDNLKAAVRKADRYDPCFQRTLEEYAAHRGFVIDPAVAYHPQGKPHVERSVPYVRESFFRGESWLDEDHVQREAIRWCREIAGTRQHGTTRRRPLAVFEEEERQALLPIQSPHFDTPAWAECVVHPDHHVQFGRALYSAPTEYLRKKVTVRGDRSLVRIYHDGKLIKTHARVKPGARSTDYDDYPQELAPYALRDSVRVIAQARKLGASIGFFTEKLLSGDWPWSNLRQAQKLLRLGHKYGRHRLEEACHRALAFDLINVRRVEDILLRALRQPPIAAPAPITPLPTRFLRPEGSFTHSLLEIRTDGDQTVPESRPETPEALRDPGHAPRAQCLCDQVQAQSRGLPGAGPPG